MSVAIKIPQPPQPTGNLARDVRLLNTWAYQVYEILNRNMEVKDDVRKVD